MSDLKKEYGLSLSLYELSDLSNLFAMKLTSQSTVPVDYGTGEAYTAVEAHTITTIYLNPGISAKEIADKTARTQSAVSQTISKLENKGLIRTERSPEDNRRVCLYATEKGAQTSIAHMEYDVNTIGDMVEEIIDRYGVEAMNNFIDILSIFTNNKDW